MTAALVLAVALAGCASDDASAPDPAASQRSAPAVPSTPPASPAAPPSTPAPAPATPSTPSAPAEPVRVEIPSLGLTEDLIDLGIADDGTLEVPEDPARVGWFSGGGRPGGPGPTVVVGHVDSTEGPAVFARLPELAPGDEITLDAADGTAVVYVVQEARDVPQTPFPTEEVFGSTTTDTLRLITCTGPYDSEAGRYTENRIVTAVPR